MNRYAVGAVIVGIFALIHVWIVWASISKRRKDHLMLEQGNKIVATVTKAVKEKFGNRPRNRWTRVVMSYEVNGVTYEQEKIESYDTTTTVGDEMIIYCDLNDPNHYLVQGEEVTEADVKKSIITGIFVVRLMFLLMFVFLD